jgi:hypothetical protein
MQSCPRGQRGLTDQQRCVGRGIHYVTSDAQQLGVVNVALTVLTVQPTGERPFGSASWPTTARSPFVPHMALLLSTARFTQAALHVHTKLQEVIPIFFWFWDGQI